VPDHIVKYNIPPHPANVLQVYTEKELIDIPLDKGALKNIVQRTGSLNDLLYIQAQGKAVRSLLEDQRED